jgi:hypothetical protein
MASDKEQATSNKSPSNELLGLAAKNVIPVPEGRLKVGDADGFSRASGTPDSLPPWFPAINCWAIVSRP